jgi:hypothetical protein
VGAHTTYDDLGPGLHLLREAEPLKRAGPMAANLRADLCATLPQAETALEERGRLPAVDVTTLSTLQVLARRVARAERIAARTRDRAVVEVGDRLTGAGSGLAVHPTTIRDRAAAVDIARGDLVAADRALANHAAAVAAAEAQAEQEAAAAQSHAAEDAARRVAARARTRTRSSGPSLRARRSRSIGLIVAAFGVALVMIAFQVPLWAALLPALAACLFALRYLRPSDGDGADEDDQRGWEEASSLLSQVATTTDEVFGARRISRELGEQQTLLEARRDRAQEHVRVAERAWYDLAGDDVDITDLEEVVRRFDPQHEDARLLAGETIGVRTAEVVLHHFQQRWLAFWRELGRDAPAPEDGEEAVRALAAQVSRPIVLVGPATALGPDLSRAAPAAPVVALDGPEADG